MSASDYDNYECPGFERGRAPDRGLIRNGSLQASIRFLRCRDWQLGGRSRTRVLRLFAQAA